MIYLILLIPLVITVALSAIYMRRLTFLMQIRHYQYLEPPKDEKVFGTPSTLFNVISYYDSQNACMSGMSELPFDLEALDRIGDEEIKTLCQKRRRISKWMPFIITFTILSIPSYFIYHVLSIIG